MEHWVQTRGEQTSMQHFQREPEWCSCHQDVEFTCSCCLLLCFRLSEHSPWESVNRDAQEDCFKVGHLFVQEPRGQYGLQKFETSMLGSAKDLLSVWAVLMRLTKQPGSSPELCRSSAFQFAFSTLKSATLWPVVNSSLFTWKEFSRPMINSAG